MRIQRPNPSNIWLVYSGLALAVMLPLLIKPGYVFALDMVFGPRIELPNEITASYPLYLVLWLANFIVPSQILQKLLLGSIVVLCGVGAHRLTELVARRQTRSAYCGGLFYAINPFTYDRFMDGQFSVLLGYALLPFFVAALFRLCFYKATDRWSILRLSGLALLVSIVSIHAVGYMLILGTISAALAAFRLRDDKRARNTLFGSLALFVLLITALSSFWIIPTLMGDSSRPGQVQRFDNRHLLGFRTDGNSSLETISNTVALQGYWGEREERFYVIRKNLPLWPLVVAPLILLAIYGFWRIRKHSEAQVLAASTATALVLAVGVTAWPFSEVNWLLYDHLPFYRAFREPQKFVSIIALAYAVLGSIGLMHLKKRWPQLDYAAILLVLLYTPSFLWAFGGQLQSRNYPADWYTVKKTYLAQASGAILFLPYHQYMYFNFAGQTISNPAPVFFGQDQVIAGDNAEIGLIERQTSSYESQIIEPLLQDKTNVGFGTKVMPLGVEYVLLSKTADWHDYSFLDHQTDLKLTTETDTLKLYHNLMYKEL